jgi:carbon-monoxide dehydrogenase medium subunit
VAAMVSVDGGTCRRARLVIGGVTGVPVDAREAAAALEGSPVSDEAIAAALTEVAGALGGALGDTYASAAYRTHLATVLARRALRTAFDRAGT